MAGQIVKLGVLDALQAVPDRDVRLITDLDRHARLHIPHEPGFPLDPCDTKAGAEERADRLLCTDIEEPVHLRGRDDATVVGFGCDHFFVERLRRMVRVRSGHLS